MAITLHALTARLTALVPALNSIPADYDQLVKDALAQLSADVPMLRTTTLAIVANTAAYDLPTDFVSLIELSASNVIGGIAVTNAGLVPVSSDYEEYYDLTGNQIVIVPTPTHASTRTLRYAAGHVLDSSDAYPRLNENAARIALLYGQYLALMAQANSVAPAGWRYSIGDEMIDKSNQGKALATQAEGLLKQYTAAVKSQKGYGSVGRVTL